MKNLNAILIAVFLCGYCISTYCQTIERIPPKHVNNSSNIHKSLSVQKSKTELKKHVGTYFIPAVNEGDKQYPPAFEEGEIIFKLINGKLVGIAEQRILPMRGLMRTRIEVLSLNANGVGKYKSSWENFDRYDNPIQKGEGLSGTIKFTADRVLFMGYSCKKVH